MTTAPLPTVPQPVRRVYLATATGTPLLIRRVVRPRPTRECATCQLVGRYSLAPPAASWHVQAYWVALDLTDALGYFFGIDLVRIARFLGAI